MEFRNGARSGVVSRAEDELRAAREKVIKLIRKFLKNMRAGQDL